MLRKRDVFIGAAIGTAAALIISPLLQLIVQLMVGDVYPIETFAGAILAALFFAVSAIVAGIYQDTPHLKTAVLCSYVIKTSLIFAVLQGLRISTESGYVFGISVAVSSVTYLTFQTLYIAKWRRRKWRKLATQRNN